MRVTWRRFPIMPITDLLLADPLQGSASGTYRLPPAMSTMCTCHINTLLKYLAIHGQLCGERSFKGGEREMGAGAGLHLSGESSSVRGAVEPVHSVSQGRRQGGPGAQQGR